MSEITYNFKDYIRNHNRLLLITIMVVFFFLCVNNVYGFVYHGLFSISTVGTNPAVGHSVIGGGAGSVLVIGTDNFLTPAEQSSFPLLALLLPLEIVVMGIIALILRIKSIGNIKAIMITGAIAIFIILTFLIINNVVSLFR